MVLKHNAERAAFNIKVFWFIIFMSVVSIVSTYMQYSLLEQIAEGGVIGEHDFEANDLRQSAVASIQLLATVISTILFLSWFRRAYGNLHRVGISYLEHSEQGAVWAFFIPFVNLVRPLLIAKEIWEETQDQVSKRDPEFSKTESDDFITYWWVIFVASNLITRVGQRLYGRSDTVEGFQRLDMFNMFGDLMQIVSAILAIQMIRKIAEVEQKLYQGVLNEAAAAASENTD